MKLPAGLFRWPAPGIGGAVRKVGVLFLLAGLAAVAEEQGPIPHAIVGGGAVTFESYPFGAYVSGVKACTGSIIAPNWVLTAATCVVRRNGTPVATVKVEHGYGSSFGARKRISRRVIRHPQFDNRKTDAGLRHDIALLELAEPFPASYAASLAIPNRLAEQTHAPSGTSAIAIGYGKMERNRHSDTLRAFSSNLYDPGYCRSQLAFRDEAQVAHSDTLCAGTATMRINSGDQGGPLVVAYSGAGDVQYLQVGLASMRAKDSSGSDVTSIFTRVSSFADWIQTSTGGAVTLIAPEADTPAREDPDPDEPDDDNDDSDDDTAQLTTRLTNTEAELAKLKITVQALQGDQDRLKVLFDQLKTVHGQAKALQTQQDNLLKSSLEPAWVRSSRPNIVFIMADDMGWADLGSYGSTATLTPHLDRLAAAGMRFSDAYAGHTVCAPSRSALMTGKHTGHTTVRANAGTAPIHDSDVTLAEVLKQAGYVTGGFGKWGLGVMGSEGAAERQGFDTFFGYYHQVHAHTYYPPFLVADGRPFPLLGNARIYGLEPAEFAYDTAAYQAYKAMSPKGPFVPRQTRGGPYQFSQDLVFERTLDFIRANRDRPFFCYAPWTPPHAAYHIPQDDPAARIYKDKPWSDRAKVHAAFVSMLDRQVGELMELLQDLGIKDKTAVFFMSDNGASNRFEGELDSSGPLRAAKRSLHEGGIRSPLIVHWPGRIAAGVVSSQVTYAPDIMPTLAALVGAEELVPDDVDGVSIAPTLLGRPDQQRQHEFLYWEWDQQGYHRAVRHGRWKLISREPGVWQVFDLVTDISESNDIASQHSELIASAEEWIQANRTAPD